MMCDRNNREFKTCIRAPVASVPSLHTSGAIPNFANLGNLLLFAGASHRPMITRAVLNRNSSLSPQQLEQRAVQRSGSRASSQPARTDIDFPIGRFHTPRAARLTTKPQVSGS